MRGGGGRARRRREPWRLLLLRRKEVSPEITVLAAETGPSGRRTSPGGRRRGYCGGCSRTTQPAAPLLPSNPSFTLPLSAIRKLPSPLSAKPSSVGLSVLFLPFFPSAHLEFFFFFESSSRFSVACDTNVWLVTCEKAHC